MPSSISDPAVDRASGSVLSRIISSPIFALAVLFSMNLLNYVDRYVFFSAGPQISKELKYTDIQFGILSASFMVVYTLVSPLVGVLGDRYNRKRLLAFGVGLWSVATVGTAFAQGFYDMFFWRALLGVGEASYGSIAPALLSDLFPPKHRNRVMGLYLLALPVGGAIGYMIGGYFGQHGDWRHAFWVVGLPGLLAAFVALMMKDPGRGASENQGVATKVDRPGLSQYLEIFKTKTFVFNTAGQAAVTFAIGAYAVWGATFYHRVRGMELAAAGKEIGILTAIAGLLGIVMGIFLTDLLGKFTKRANLVWPFLAVAGAVPFGTLALLEPEKSRSLMFLFIASAMMASVLGPSNTVTANVVPASRRAAGYALCIFLVHLFGDISSPYLIGVISDLFGTSSVIASPIGRFFASMGAGPTVERDITTNLTVGMLAVVPMLVLGCIFFLLGSRHLPEDQERARIAGGGEPLDGTIYH
jgi:MFS family permease